MKKSVIVIFISLCLYFAPKTSSAAFLFFSKTDKVCINKAAEVRSTGLQLAKTELKKALTQAQVEYKDAEKSKKAAAQKVIRNKTLEANKKFAEAEKAINQAFKLNASVCKK